MNHAFIFDIYRGTTHDGPGLRSTVFFKGCSLSCQWCHNPEGISPKQQVWWDSRNCIGCMLCRHACINEAVVTGETGIRVDDTKCTRCGDCVKACPSTAMQFIGEKWSMDKLVNEVMRDKAYYDKTGGGVTCSGGECLLQHGFVSAFLRKLHHQGVDTAVDTCGMVSWQAFTEVLPFTDHILYDLKLMDGDLHQKYTGQDNALILKNVRRIAQGIAQGGITSDLWIRTPLIPGATATWENISALGRFIAEELYDVVSHWELCAFNNSCTSKYERLNQPWSYADTSLMDHVSTQALRQAAVDAGVPEERVAVTGLVAE